MFTQLEYTHSGENEIEEMLNEQGVEISQQEKKSLIVEIKFLCRKVLEILKEINILMVIISFGLV